MPPPQGVPLESFTTRHGTSKGKDGISFAFSKHDYQKSTVSGPVPGLHPPILSGSREGPMSSTEPRTPGPAGTQEFDPASAQQPTQKMSRAASARSAPSTTPRSALKKSQPTPSPFELLIADSRDSMLGEEADSAARTDQARMTQSSFGHSSTPLPHARSTLGADGRFHTDSDSEDEYNDDESQHVQVRSSQRHSDSGRPTSEHSHENAHVQPSSQQTHHGPRRRAASQTAREPQGGRAVPPTSTRGHSNGRQTPYPLTCEPDNATHHNDGQRFPWEFGSRDTEASSLTDRPGSQPTDATPEIGNGSRHSSTPSFAHPVEPGLHLPSGGQAVQFAVQGPIPGKGADPMDPEAMTRAQMRYTDPVPLSQANRRPPVSGYNIDVTENNTPHGGPPSTRQASRRHAPAVAGASRPSQEVPSSSQARSGPPQLQAHPQQRPHQLNPQRDRAHTNLGFPRAPQTPQKPTVSPVEHEIPMRGRLISQAPPQTPSRPRRARSASVPGTPRGEDHRDEDLVLVAEDFQNKLAQLRLTNAELAERNEELQNTLQDMTREREAAAKELDAAKVATAKAHADLQRSKGIAGRWVQRYKEQQNNLLNAQEALTQSTKDELERVRAAVKAEKKSGVDKIHRMIKSLKDDGQLRGVGSAQRLLGERGQLRELLRDYQVENAKLVQSHEAVEKHNVQIEAARQKLSDLYAEVRQQKRVLAYWNSYRCTDNSKLLSEQADELKAAITKKQEALDQAARDTQILRELQTRVERQDLALSEALAKVTRSEMHDVERNERLRAYERKLQDFGIKVDQLDGSMEEDDDFVSRSAQRMKDEMERRERQWAQKLKGTTEAQMKLDGELKRAVNKYEASKASLLALEKDQRDKEKTLLELNAELRRLRMVENDAVAAQENMVKQTESLKADLAARAIGEKSAANLLAEKEKQLAEAKTAYKTIASQTSAKDQEIGLLKGEVESNKKQIKELSLEKQRLEGLVKALQEEKPAEDVQRAQKLNDLQSALVATKTQLNESAASFESLLAKADLLTREKRDLEAQLGAAEKNAAQAAKAAQAAQASLNTDRDEELEQLRTACDAAAAEKVEMIAAHKEALAKALAESQTPTAEGSLRSRFDDGKLEPDEAAFVTEFKKSIEANKLRTTEYHKKQLESRIITMDSMQSREGSDKQLVKMQKDLEKAEMRVQTEKQKFDSSQTAHKAEVLRLKAVEEDNKKKEETIRALEAKVRALSASQNTSSSKKAAATPGSKKKRRVVSSDDDCDVEAASAECDMNGLLSLEQLDSTAGNMAAAASNPDAEGLDLLTVSPPVTFPSGARGTTKTSPLTSSSALTAFSGGSAPFKPPHKTGPAGAMLPPSANPKKPRLNRTTSNARIHGSGDPEKLNKRFKVPGKVDRDSLVPATPTDTSILPSPRALSSRPRKTINYAEKTLDEIEEEDIGAFPSQVDLTREESSQTDIKSKGKAKSTSRAVDSDDDIEASDDDEQTMVDNAPRKTRFDLPPSSSGPSSPVKTLNSKDNVVDPIEEYLQFSESSQEGNANTDSQVLKVPKTTAHDHQSIDDVAPDATQSSADVNVPDSQTHFPMPLTQNPDKLGAKPTLKRATRTSSRTASGMLPSSHDGDAAPTMSQATAGHDGWIPKRKRAQTGFPNASASSSSKIGITAKKAPGKSKSTRSNTATSSQSRVLSSQVDEVDETDGKGEHAAFDDSQGVTSFPEGRKVKKARTRKI